MACVFNFHLIGENKGLMDSAVMEAESMLARLEDQLSLYIEHSDTTRINRAKTGDQIHVSEETVDCLLRSFEASARLQGKFHPFLGQASIDQKNQRPELIHLRGIEETNSSQQDPVISLDVESNTLVKLREGPLLDFGGIGKGYALDLLRSHFIEWEFSQGLLDSAGSAFLAMAPPDGSEEWELKIGYNDITSRILLEDGQAVASSGELFQKRHVVDPQEANRDHYPWSRSYAFAPDAALADAASTAGLILDLDSLNHISEEKETPLSFVLYTETERFSCGSPPLIDTTSNG